MNRLIKVVLTMLLVAAVQQVHAETILLTFEGLQHEERILDYYNGGAGSLGSTGGPNYGVSFTSNAIALTEGDFAPPPSPPTIAFFLSGTGDIMNVAGGFADGFSFYYTAALMPGSVSVWSGLDATGTLLATLALPVNGACTPPDPTFCVWTPLGVAFAGVAHSVDFAGVANMVGFDNMTLGSVTPIGPALAIPEPASLILVGSGLVAFARARRKRL